MQVTFDPIPVFQSGFLKPVWTALIQVSEVK